MAWKFKKNLPVFIQISDRIRGDIVSGVYSAGEQLPTVRQLSLAVSANPNTVQHALSLLEEEGLIETRGTLGKFVSSDEEKLRAAKEKLKRQAIESLFEEAASLGITAEEIIIYAKEIQGL